MKEDKFPKIKKSIQDFFEDEDGSITRGKALTIGGMVIVLGILLSETAYATHRTHSTHRTHNVTHGSHTTHSTHYNTHSNHATQGSHDSHSSHVSYTSASNYGSTPTSTGKDWPNLSAVQSIDSPVIADVSQNGMGKILDTITSQGVDITHTAVTTPNTSDIMQIPPDTPTLTVIED